MSTIADLIEDIRIELDDESSTRWTDANLVKLIAKSVRRASHVLRKNEIPVAREYDTITTVAGTEAYDLPTDFMALEGLYRDSTSKKMVHASDAEYESITSADTCEAFCIRDGQVKINGTPASVETLTLIYYPKIDTSAYATDTTMPWDGKFDDPIVEYCAIRCKNIDEMDFNIDAQLMADLEKAIMLTYGSDNPTITTMKGWM